MRLKIGLEKVHFRHSIWQANTDADTCVDRQGDALCYKYVAAYLPDGFFFSPNVRLRQHFSLAFSSPVSVPLVIVRAVSQ